jgi:DNA-binding Xre family transcriptional regulator
MRISYNKLWDLMKRNKMKKTELAKAAEITGYTMTKINKNEPVSLEVIMRLCKVFHCNIGDLLDITEEN